MNKIKKLYTRRQVLNILNRLRDNLWDLDDAFGIDSEGSIALNEFECCLIDEIMKIK